jgi:hypothetical protein
VAAWPTRAGRSEDWPFWGYRSQSRRGCVAAFVLGRNYKKLAAAFGMWHTIKECSCIECPRIFNRVHLNRVSENRVSEQ